MRDLSAPTRKRLAELGTVRARHSSKTAAHGDPERGGELELENSGEPPLRAQYGSSTSAAVRDWQSGAADGLEARGSSGEQQDGVGQMRGPWDGLAARSSSVVRFASHARSASGTQFPLQR